MSHEVQQPWYESYYTPAMIDGIKAGRSAKFEQAVQQDLFPCLTAALNVDIPGYGIRLVMYGISTPNPRHPGYSQDDFILLPDGTIGAFDGVGSQEFAEDAAIIAADLNDRHHSGYSMSVDNPFLLSDANAELLIEDGLRFSHKAIQLYQNASGRPASTAAAITRPYIKPVW